jgi:K+-sensing histidine kinase KdpD
MDRWVDRLFAAQRRTGLVLLLSAIAPLVVCGICAGFRDQVATSSVALLLVLCVVASAASGLRAAALVSALSAGLWFDFFLTRPYYSLAIAGRDDVELTVLLVAIGALVTETVLWGHRQQSRAARRSGYLDGALRTAESAVRGDLPPDALVRLVAAEIAGVLGVPASRYVPGPVHDARPAVLEHDGNLSRAGREVDVERRGLPVDEETTLLVRRGDHVVGHFVITAASSLVYPTSEQRRVAVLLADLVATAAVRQEEPTGRTPRNEPPRRSPT